MAVKVQDNLSARHAILGLPDANGYQNPADVNASNQLQVAVGTSTGGSLNATGQVSITGSATLIIAAGNRQGVQVTNPSSTVTVYLGGSGVTTGNGLPLLPLSSQTLPAVSAVYGIVTTGSQTVGYVEIT